MALSLTLIYVIELLERFAYYGARTILFLFLLNHLNWHREETSSFYGLFTAAGVFLTILGGVLSDLSKRPALIALIGNALSTLALLSLFAIESPVLVKSALFGLALGTGLYKPAIASSLLRVSIAQKRRFDAIYTGFYAIVNLGAFCGPLVIGWLSVTGNPEDYKIGFLIAGAASLIATVLLSISYRNLSSNDLLYISQPYSLTGIQVGQLAIWFVCGLVFWLGFELLPRFGGYQTNSRELMYSAILSVAVCILVIPLGLMTSLRSAWKVAGGLLLGIATMLLFAAAGYSGFGTMALFIVAEMLVAPVLMAQILVTASPRFTGTIFSAYLILHWIAGRITNQFTEIYPENGPVHLYAVSFIFLTVAIVVLVLDHFKKKEEIALPELR
jgi:dipeptide/tripeptide permease